jgi:hypothetical protein
MSTSHLQKQVGANGERRSAASWTGYHLAHVVGEIAKPKSCDVLRPVTSRPNSWYFHGATHNQSGGDAGFGLNLKRFHFALPLTMSRCSDVAGRCRLRRMRDGAALLKDFGPHQIAVAAHHRKRTAEFSVHRPDAR